MTNYSSTFQYILGQRQHAAMFRGFATRDVDNSARLRNTHADIADMLLDSAALYQEIAADNDARARTALIDLIDSHPHNAAGG